MVSMKTFIRRPGNKTNFLKYIIPRIPEFPGKYIEPFLGTGAVYLNLLPKKAILNDLNNDKLHHLKTIFVYLSNGYQGSRKFHPNLRNSKKH
jgi:DNA adenine methylase